MKKFLGTSGWDGKYPMPVFYNANDIKNDEVEICKFFLNDIKTLKRVNRASYTTYGMKHIIEITFGTYVSNESCIEACEQLGIKLNYPYRGNPQIAISKKAVNRSALAFMIDDYFIPENDFDINERWKRLKGYLSCSVNYGDDFIESFKPTPAYIEMEKKINKMIEDEQSEIDRTSK